LRFAKRSSTDGGPPGAAIRTALLVAAVALASTAAVLSGISEINTLAIARVVTAVGAAIALALYLYARERRRHEHVEGALAEQASFLERLVESMGTIASSLDAEQVLEQARVEAERLFGARAALLPRLDGTAGLQGRVLVVPLRTRGDEVGALRLERDEPFERADVARATVLADFAARSSDNARLFAEAQVREAERSRLSDQLITAEQDERRRLANELHDGAVQSMSGIALMLDAAVGAVESGRVEEAMQVMRSALDRHRDTIRSLRDLSFNLEPVVLRDQGFAPAVRALTEQLGLAHEVQFDVQVDAADALGAKTQAALYQIIRQALTQAIRRGPPKYVAVRVTPTERGEIETCISDDAPGERRRTGFDEMAERARTLNGRFFVDQSDDGGTAVRVVLPSYAAGG
jgi:two-component system sensor histidine kinase UhpB